MNKIILLLLIPLFLNSCSNWLDVSPDDEVNSKTLFKTGEGYRVALNGIYNDMASGALYGREMSWGFTDALAQYYSATYKYPNDHPYPYAIEYNYKEESVKSLIAGIWTKTYTTIANCNNLLKNIENADPAIFRGYEQEKNLIHGEALALKAFLHFDILRLFAPAPRLNDTKAYVPYIETYGSIFQAPSDVKSMLAKIERDLLKAKGLTGSCDTIAEHKIWFRTQYRIEGALGIADNNVPEDLFFAYRGFHMNYYAVTATLARVYAYADEYEKAYRQAQEVIDATYNSGTAKVSCFTFTDPANYETNPKLYDDVIFALSNQKLIDEYSAYQSDRLTLIIKNYESIFTSGVSDKREKLFYTPDGWYYRSRKYLQTTSQVGGDLIPMLRMSEMYYITSEYLYRNQGIDAGIKRLEDLQVSRGMAAGQLQIQNEAGLENEILKDAVKEFCGEGQTFFWQKRYGKKPGANTEFVLPLPDSELVY